MLQRCLGKNSFQEQERIRCALMVLYLCIFLAVWAIKKVLFNSLSHKNSQLAESGEQFGKFGKLLRIKLLMHFT